MDYFWHLLNLLGPAFGLAAWASLGVKLLWWRALRSVSFFSLMLGASLACSLASLLGLWVFGVDGKVSTYAGMIGVCALSFWWRGFKKPSKAAANPSALSK